MDMVQKRQFISTVATVNECHVDIMHLFSSDFIFTARHYAKHGICRRRVSVCLSVRVCVSVTLRYCIKMAKHKITQTTPHDSPMILVF